MSGMNGNAVSQCKNMGERLKLLYYGLEHLPVELLFSECARLSSCEVDSWIPREVVPERFSGTNTLQLGPDGFAFRASDEKESLKFLLLPSSTNWQNPVLLFLPDEVDNTQTKYRVDIPKDGMGELTTSSQLGWCILSEGRLNPRGAKFIINRIVGNKVFLLFDCPLRLERTDVDDAKTTEQRLGDVSIALPADSRQEFVIEKSSASQTLSMSRPQNPEQYSDRLMVISQTLWWIFSYLERKLMEKYLPETVSNSYLFLIPWSMVSYRQINWIEQAIHAFVHYAWVETYQPTWRSTGPWRWFWKLSNYEPPIPFMTLNKYCCTAIFYMSAFTNSWSGMMSVSVYWRVAYPLSELMNMYLIVAILKPLSWLLGW
jgi:hypothetical protein